MTNIYDTIKELRIRIGADKAKLEQFITDKSIPLHDRWDAWISAPDCLKNITPWIHRFAAFKDLDRFDDEVLYEHENRGTKVAMEHWDLHLFGVANATDDEDCEYEPWETKDGNKVTMDHYNAWREEVLAGNIGFVSFDW